MAHEEMTFEEAIQELRDTGFEVSRPMCIYNEWDRNVVYISGRDLERKRTFNTPWDALNYVTGVNDPAI